MIPAASRLCVEEVTLGYDGDDIVHQLSLAVPDGAVTSIIGPNGCGKSTLLRAMARLMVPRSGRVLLDGEPLHRQPTRSVATRLGMLPQNPTAPAGLTVADLVSRGRNPRQRWYQQFSVGDERVVAEALEATGIAALADVPMDELSGGQRQRAWISMVLAQETDIVLLDEPTSFLDLAHQVELLELVQRLNAEHGRTIVMVLHDISLAARYSDHMVAMRQGRIHSAGSPSEVVTERGLAEIFGLSAQVVADPVAGRPHVIPLGNGPLPEALASSAERTAEAAAKA
ncbi:ABC transporter ATP-binding protein [Paeniglutamicibacter sulfureus]|uniref:ABC transporter ATP-binding protein n=1 Tax=Paeniglutamicibacter sulfureus TaxID=43666 RepID=UPI002666D151|nr:ABC transporter ATP-binding protein [Paeniglutamicibacter sulfureus]MDO2933024.1 ABC transporter ATP-binding protein [Paeniglutamicibacter sulfureus]